MCVISDTTSIAAASWMLVIATRILVFWQIRIAKKDLRIRTHLAYAEKFDNDRMLNYRKKLAQQFRDNVDHKEIQENVMDFFEDLGLLLRKKAIDKDMAWATFSYYAIFWYNLCQDYIFEEQKLNNYDTSLFQDFKYFAGVMFKMDEKERAKRNKKEINFNLRKEDIERFIDDEINVI